MFSREDILGKHQSLPVSDPDTGNIECNWTLGPETDVSKYKWNVPTTAVSGVYIAKLINETGFASYSIFVVRDDLRQSNIVFQTSDTTWQAYNNFPYEREGINPANDPYPQQVGSQYSGKSLYNFNSFGATINSVGKQAREVSFNRPYGLDNNQITLTAGQFFTWEYNMVRWLERNSYDVGYISNLDTHEAKTTNIFAPGRHKVFLSVGHDEYWSWKMRDNVKDIRNDPTQPMNLAFFSANTMYWQIRFDSSSPNSQPASAPNRTIVAYKELARNTNPIISDPKFSDSDPSNNYLVTNLWRDNRKNNCPLSNLNCADNGCPLSDPDCHCPRIEPTDSPFACTRPSEDEVMGVQYSSPFNQISQDPDDPGGVCPVSSCPAEGDLKIPAAACPTWMCGSTNASNGFYQLGSLIGYEAARIFTNHTYSNRSSFLKIGESPVFNLIANPNEMLAYTGYNSHLVYFTLPNGAKVFSTETIQYPWGLDDHSPVYSRQQHRTENYPAYTNTNAQVLAESMFGCLIGGVCQ